MVTDLCLVVSDIDGTLVRDDKSLSDNVVAAAKRLIASGVSMSLISARPPSGMVWIADKLELSTSIAAFNGGTIVGPDRTVVSAVSLSPEIAKRALDLIAKPSIFRWLFSRGRWYAERPAGHHDLREQKSTNQQPTFGADFIQLLGAVDKIVAVSDEHGLLTALERTLTQTLGQDATVVQSQVYSVEITARSANKGVGLTALAAAAGVPLKQVAVIGDQRNDLAMFRRAGLSIAMGQAPDEVRKAATLVTGSNSEDGVAQAIDNILMPMIGY
jgi:Cof subfamily protein (haloacid dehalogenase superfamily)